MKVYHDEDVPEDHREKAESMVPAFVVRGNPIREATQIPIVCAAFDTRWKTSWDVWCWIPELVTEYDQVRKGSSIAQEDTALRSGLPSLWRDIASCHRASDNMWAESCPRGPLSWVRARGLQSSRNLRHQRRSCRHQR